MKKRDVLKEIPLLCSIAAMAVVMTLCGIIGKGRAYADLRYSFKEAPIMALAFTGMGQGLWPFQAAPEQDLQLSLTQELIETEALSVSQAAQPATPLGEAEAVALLPASTEDATGAIPLPEVLLEEHMQPVINVNLALEEESWDEATRNKYGRIALLSDPETGIAPTQYFDLLPSYGGNFETVDATYFKDALFLGDSRTVGLSMYVPELSAQATFYAKTSLTAAHALEQRFVETPLGTLTPLQALQQTQFRKIYVALGVNELGSGTTESFVQGFAQMLLQIRALQPDAIIYISSIMHVSQKKDEEGGYVNNAVINERNNALSHLADAETIFYIDMNEATDDATGVLQEDLTFDGVHLKAVSYELWYRFLSEHAIVKE